MSDPKKRRLSLGDIIRKMNENAPVSPDSDIVSGKHPSAEEKRTNGRPMHNYTPRHNHQSSSRFPVQPRYGTSSFPKNEAVDGFEKKSVGAQATAVEMEKEVPAHQEKKIPHTLHGTHHEQKSVQIDPLTPDAYEDGDEEEFDFFKYLNVILRRKTVIIIVTVIMGIFSLFSFINAPKFYLAKARLLFRIQTNNIIEDAHSVRLFIAKEQILNTHLELLKSRSVLEQVAQNLGEDIKAGQISGGLNIKQGETNGEKNSVIELSYKHLNAQKAADIVNNLCKTYIDYSRGVNTQEQTRLIVKLETQIDKLESELAERENALRLFKEENRMVQLSDETNLSSRKLSTMELALQQTQLDLLSSKEKLNTLKTQIGRQEVNVVQSMTYKNPFQDKISELELQLNTYSAELSDDHFKIKTITQKIEKLKEAMQSEIAKEAATRTFIKNPIRESLLQSLVNLSIDISALETKRTAQEQIIEKLNKELKALPSMEQRYAHLHRETESLVQTLRMLKTKYEETKIQRDAQESDLKIFELADVPEAAFSSKNPSSVLIGIIVGVILGIALAFVIEYLDQTVKEPAEVEKSLDLPLLGVVPLIETESAIIENTDMLAKSVLEPFRALRANLKHIASKNNDRVLMLCSAVKGEGKTTLAVNLAITFALDGKKVVIIDADLRRPQVHHYLNLDKETGFSDYLLGEKSVDEILKTTQHVNLKVITSGERPENPSELLGTPLFDKILEEIRGYGDLIIFDSPALLPVSDSITMAPKMDGCIMVVRTMWTPQKAAKQAKSQITRIGSKLLGGVLNGVSQSHGCYPYYYGYYGYKYSYYEDENPKKFSLRRFGIEYETKIKQVVANLRNSMPQQVARLMIFGGYLVRKKTFWILIALLIAIIAARMVYFPKTAEKNHALIYKLPENQGMKAVHKTPMQSAISISAVDPKLQREENSIMQNFYDSGATMNMGLQGSANSIQRFTDAYKDSLIYWIDAFNRGDSTRLLSFYAKDRFRFPHGAYEQWKDSLKSEMLKRKKQEVVAVIEEMDAEIYRGETVKTRITTRLETPVSTEAEEAIMVWAYTNGNWRIIGQKKRNVDK